MPQPASQPAHTRTRAISPGESEFYALTNAICELVTVRQLVEEFGYVFATASQVFSDAAVARSLAEFGASSRATRFIDRRYKFAEFYTNEGVIGVLPVKGAHNPSNGLSKFTFGIVFVKERAYMMGLNR